MQHRAYQPALPCGSKFLQYKWDKAQYQIHKEKVKTAKPTINPHPPEKFAHLQCKLKKIKLEEERMSIIHRDDKMLLDKISNLRTTKGNGNINNYEHKSLCLGKQQRELRRVEKENQAMAERLSRCRPCYNTRKWHEDWERSEGYKENIARYPRSMNNVKAGPKSVGQSMKEGAGKDTNELGSSSREEKTVDDGS